MGESEGDGRAAPSGSGTDVQLRADRLCAAVHGAQAVAARARLGGHADAVVGDGQRDRVGPPASVTEIAVQSAWRTALVSASAAMR